MPDASNLINLSARAACRQQPRQIMPHPRVPIIILIVMWSCGVVPTFAAAPTTSVATTVGAPVPVAIDLSTPKSAAKTMFHGISQGDRAAIAAVIYAADPQQQRLADATVDLIVNGKHLGDAARARFGDAAADPIAKGMLDPKDLSLIDNATVKTNGAGDIATMEVPGQARPMSFHKQGDKWRLVITDFGGAAPENIARQTSLVRMMADAMDESARDVAAGKYASVDAAVAGIQRRLHEVMLNFNRPATTRAST